MRYQLYLEFLGAPPHPVKEKAWDSIVEATYYVKTENDKIRESEKSIETYTGDRKLYFIVDTQTNEWSFDGVDWAPYRG